MLEQLSSLRNIESQLSLQEQIEKLVVQNQETASAQLSVQQQLTSLVLQNQLTSAGGLIDKFAMGLDSNNDLVIGMVTSVRVEDGKVRLERDTGKELPMEQVSRIDDSSDGLIGKFVSGFGAENEKIEGIVTGIGEQDGQTVLELNTEKVLKLDQVRQVSSVSGDG